MEDVYFIDCCNKVQKNMLLSPMYMRLFEGPVTKRVGNEEIERMNQEDLQKGDGNVQTD